MKRRLQNKIAESDFLLPITAAGAGAYWGYTWCENMLQAIGGLLLTVLTAYLMMQLVAIYSLLRIRSRIITSVYLLLMAGCVFLHTEINALIATACLAVSLSTLFHTYENSKATVDTLHAYFMLAVGALFYAPMIWLTPILLFSQLVFMRSLSSRTLGAALIGVLTPFWVWFCILLCQGEVTPLIAHFQTMIPQDLVLNLETWKTQILQIQWNASSSPLLMTLFVVFIEIIGFIHYVVNKYDDKIQVRTYYYTFLFLQCVCTIALVLLPSHSNYLMPLIIMCSAPTIGHYIGLTHSVFSTLWFIICSISYVLLLILNSL